LYRERHNRGFGYGGFRKVRRVYARRSGLARQIDENMKATIAKSAKEWLAHPNRLDFPDVDTPKLTDEELREEQDRRWREQRDQYEAPKGKTPTQACGITIEGKNKWLT